MSNSTILERIDTETRDIINYLKNRDEICDLNIDEINGATKNQISEWEIRNFCALPQDLKMFYMNHNGLLIEWKCKIDKETVLPLGKIQINGIKELTRVGSVLSKDFGEPSIYDLEELNFSNINSVSKSRNPNQEKNNSENSSESDDGDTENEEKQSSNNETKKIQKSRSGSKPHFDETSRNFELDNCNGFGKVCLVYHNCRAGMMSSDGAVAEVWYLDRSLTWHFLANSFRSYYRLLISHLGLPQWQMLFTPDGLPTFLNQWYYLFAPGRMLIQHENWNSLDFLKIVENNNINNNLLTIGISKKLQAPQQPSNSSENKNKINFSLFEDKQTKNTKNTSNSAVTPGQNAIIQPDKNSNSAVRSRSNNNKRIN